MFHQERRDELEGLDLAIEQQKQNLHEMRLEEKELKIDRRSARGELYNLKKRNDRRLMAR